MPRKSTKRKGKGSKKKPTDNAAGNGKTADNGKAASTKAASTKATKRSARMPAANGSSKPTSKPENNGTQAPEQSVADDAQLASPRDARLLASKEPPSVSGEYANPARLGNMDALAESDGDRGDPSNPSNALAPSTQPDSAQLDSAQIDGHAAPADAWLPSAHVADSAPTLLDISSKAPDDIGSRPPLHLMERVGNGHGLDPDSSILQIDMTANAEEGGALDTSAC